MKVIVLYPNAFWLVLTLPLLQIFRSKLVKKSSISVPSIALLKKIIGKPSAPKFDFLLCLRQMEILLLIAAYAEPMLMTLSDVIRYNRYLVIASLVCFLAEIFLQNTFFHKIP
ncbi:MAG: hypothetical protein LBI81_03065 [Puniceicoccales bacterium]|jgi:hypothetical protein|nr:hypothetical protein [Puniceicoccales bacterium]